MNNNKYKFVNTPLPYSYSDMEPYIDRKTMLLHHDRHLQTYIDNLNNILQNYPRLLRLSLEELVRISPKLPQPAGTEIRNNAGGVLNHRMYFNTLSPIHNTSPVGRLSAAINGTFGSFDNFKKDFKSAALSVFGSGYAWLVSDRKGLIRIVTTPNQNNPISDGLCPILGIDVWEHAYYLKNYNRRDEYIDNWFHVINWNQANENFLKCMGINLNSSPKEK